MKQWNEMTEEEQHQLRHEQWRAMFKKMADEGVWDILPLWDAGAPSFDPAIGQEEPKLAVRFHADGPARGMFIICAGGGYLHKAYMEAKPVAEYFYERGYNTAVLDYRFKPYDYDIIFGDARRAVRLMRYHAGKYNTLPDKIAIGGFSAGGNLSGMAGVTFDYGDENAPDPVERVSSRPDVVLQIYGSSDRTTENMGLSYDPAVQQEKAVRSVRLHLREDCPPFFLAQTATDDPRNVSNMAIRLAEWGIPFESHIFQGGHHGGGLYAGEDAKEVVPHTAHWAELAAEWLESYGF